MNFYEQAWLYDLVHAKPADSENINFYERAIDFYGQPVLELASGTGNFLVTLTENEYDISGTEKFEERINFSNQKAESRQVETNLFNADMRDFELNQKFNLIFIAGNGLQHLKTIEEVASCFASVKRHLTPNGRFIVEVFNPSVELLSRTPPQRYFVGEYKTEEGWIVIETTVRYDSATQINYIDWHYKNQYWKEEQTISFTMRQFFPQELDALFLYNGFKIEHKFGNFDQSPFTAKSPKQIIVATLI
ncbi:MAG TPA: class I SAM-dependent methyltransferase [Pyrinomonadaceae bacterium]|nr:class I SAM-dependent methyltransferase [Pyrinomonadaceae bacterium]